MVQHTLAGGSPQLIILCPLHYHSRSPANGLADLAESPPSGEQVTNPMHYPADAHFDYCFCHVERVGRVRLEKIVVLNKLNFKRTRQAPLSEPVSDRVA